MKQLNAMPTDKLLNKTMPTFNDNNLSSCINIFVSHNVVATTVDNKK